MSFNNEYLPAEYTASAGQTVFPFTFKVFEESDVVVYLTPTGQTADDDEDRLTLSTEYTVSIDGDNGGFITLTSGATSGDKITILRVLPINRDTEYQKNGDLLAETLNSDQNYQTYLIGDLSRKVDKVLKFPESAQGLDGTLPNPSPDNYIRWNSTGTALENDETIPDNVQLAKDWANEDEDVIVADGEYSSKHYSIKASDSATASATSATNSANSATASATSASQALAYRNEAEAFADSIDTGNFADVTAINTFTASQRGAITVDNDGIFDLNVTNNFSCTPTALFTLTFTNISAGQSGQILLDNSGGYVITADTNTKVDANFLSTVSTAPLISTSSFI